MKRILQRVVVVACLVPTGCASSRPSPQAPAGPAPAQSVSPAQAQPQPHAMMHEMAATSGPGYTVADVQFMQGMIGHHAQAVTMAALVPTHGAGERVAKLAQKIDISQRDEIELMRHWLADRDQAVPDDMHAHAMQMPGMLTPEQMKQLEAARGREFDRLFLRFMIQHHRGALTMVADLFRSPGAAQDSDIFRFVTDVDFDQRAEIYVMQSMLDTLDTERGS